ncbi:MAG: radical SAM protein, partial [Candidatus Omnitrophica bacterium]|nr:radical SAM protein [Candidatus Omnitrophota bacterium]
GFSCLTATMNNTNKIASRIKDYNKNIRIVLGNIHASLFADELLKQGIADIVVRGEGELTMLELVSCLREGKDLHGIHGISFSSGANVYHNPDRGPIEDLDILPYPALHLLDIGKYNEVPLASIYKSRASAILASRGCPYRCIFCTQDRIHKRPRYRRIDSVVDEIEYMYNRYKVDCLGFTDTFFPFSIDSGLEFCDKFIERGLHKKVRWVTETRVDMVSPELLKRMKQAGAYLVMYGFEVGNQMILNKLKKGTTLEQARSAMRHTKDAGIMTLGLFMLGMPGETIQTCEDTINFAKELDCDFVKFNVVIPYPGSELFNSCVNKRGNAEDLDKFNSWYDWFSDSGDLLYTPEGMTSKELKDLQRKAMFSYYVRPKIILRNVIKKRISLKFFAYGAYILINSAFRILANKIKIKS